MKNNNQRKFLENYFMLPNEIFNLKLCSGEIAVYAYLLYCENRKTFTCYPSHKTIGKAIGMSRNTVKKYVDSLIEKQLITAEPTSVITQNREKRNGNLRYTIRPIAEAIEQYYEGYTLLFSREAVEEILKRHLGFLVGCLGAGAVIANLFTLDGDSSAVR